MARLARPTWAELEEMDLGLFAALVAATPDGADDVSRGLIRAFSALVKR